MRIALNISYDVTDDSAENEAAADELIRDEAGVFVSSLRSRLEAAGINITSFDVQETAEP
jgi:hypothetical protein